MQDIKYNSIFVSHTYAGALTKFKFSGRGMNLYTTEAGYRVVAHLTGVAITGWLKWYDDPYTWKDLRFTRRLDILKEIDKWT